MQDDFQSNFFLKIIIGYIYKYFFSMIQFFFFFFFFFLIFIILDE